MSLTLRDVAPLFLAAGTVASLALAPIAAADTPLPQPGSENASDTISDLQSRGYDVQINWVNGIPRVDLSQCWVNGINTAAASGSLQTVYVDVECPK
jgi:hypothetical protein